jgi:hypothetical protein
VVTPVLSISLGDEIFEGLQTQGEKDSHDFFPDDIKNISDQNKRTSKRLKTKHASKLQKIKATICNAGQIESGYMPKC